MLVSEIMSRGLVTVLPEDTAESAARLLSQHSVGSIPVCTEDGILRGVITDRDIAVRCVAADLPGSTPVAKIMSKGTVTVEVHADVREAVKLMTQSKVRRLPVVNNGRVVGVIAMADMMKCHSCDAEIAVAMCEISTPDKWM